MKETLCRKGCCTVKGCPLVPAWATTIHKFQGFEAGFEEKDMFRYIICDPGDLAWEKNTPGAFYVALSRARTMGDFSSDSKFTRKSSIYWKGDGINIDRILEGSMKINPRRGGPRLIKCETVVKRDRWVNYLKEKQAVTSTNNYTQSDIKRFHSQRYSQTELRNKITQMITTPNETWQKLKRDNYLAPSNFFKNYT